jgi:hypothetical protein
MTMTAPSVDPLNATLYSLLEHKFGEIRIANEGAAAHIQRFADPLRPGRFVERAHTWGEYYCVNCPFCQDARFRLWINHLYGADYENNRRTRTHLATCYNEDCISKPGRREQLEDMVFGGGKRLFKKVAIRAPSAEFVHKAVAAPGEICSIAGLPEFHPAVKYVRSRKFDPLVLDAKFQIGVCTYTTEAAYKIMLNRLYMPIHFNGELVGWQGRTVNDGGGPKYFNCPGTSKSRMLYNYDRAREQPYVVVVEGVPSVWRIGDPAVCIFGKTMSLWQQTTISTTWAGKPIILMLDNDARVEMDHAAELLRARGADVRTIYMPDKRDPADYSEGEIQDMIAKELC